MRQLSWAARVVPFVVAVLLAASVVTWLAVRASGAESAPPTLDRLRAAALLPTREKPFETLQN